MHSENRIVYTKAAHEQLARFKEAQVEALETFISESKDFPGADNIEITAADIIEYSKRLVLRKTNKRYWRYLVLYAYFLFGLVIALLGSKYNDIVFLLRNGSEQGTVILVGSLIAFLSGITLLVLKLKDRNTSDIRVRAYREEIDALHKAMLERQQLLREHFVLEQERLQRAREKQPEIIFPTGASLQH